MNTTIAAALLAAAVTIGLAPARAAEAPQPRLEAITAPQTASGTLDTTPPTTLFLEPLEASPAQPAITFRHGDISWLPALATQAGWPPETHAKLAKIVLRESGGCPNRRGGDAVDANCNITHVTEWNHRSDTGLLQINGINYNLERNKWARVCLDLGICHQEPLLDPLTNLKAGYLLYQYGGWAPWDPCMWGEEWAHRCDRPSTPDTP